jgi:hypothetical protein
LASVLKFENSYILLTYYFDDKLFKYKLQGIIDRNNKYGEMYDNAQVESEIIFYPVFKLLNYKQPVFDYTKQFENINFRNITN